MEMTFPQSGHSQTNHRMRAELGTLLVTAIARQANAPTAQAMLVTRRSGTRARFWSADAMEQRIRYFSHPEDRDVAGGYQPRGAFFPIDRAETRDERNDEARVYQDASANIKARAVEPAVAEIQPEHAGHGQSRTI